MKLPSRLFIAPGWLIVCAALLLGSAGVIVVIGLPNVVSNDTSTADRWEPTGAAGVQWLHAWAQIQDGNSFVSAWNGSSWTSPKALTAPNGFGTDDVNMNWDATRGRFVFVALDLNVPHNVWYGYSTDSSGTAWVFGNNGQPIFSASIAAWDYPSVGVDATGRVIAGAVRYLPCPPPQTGSCPYGYFSAISTGGNNFSGPYPIISALNPGAQSRVVATNDLFEAFIPTLNTKFLPTYIYRKESADGINWNGPLSIGMGSFGAPNNNTPPGTSSTILYYAPLLAAQGYTNGLWAVAFQANNGGYNNVTLCNSNRGCGWVNSQADDQFLAGTSVSGDGGYWVAYLTYQSPRNPPLIAQAIYFPSGKPGIGATTVSGINPTSWTKTQPRCTGGGCYEAGDFATVASNPYAASSTPFIQTGSVRPNDLFQVFVEDPQTLDNVPNFTPNFIPIAEGADVTNLAVPVPSGSEGLPPGLKTGMIVP